MNSVCGRRKCSAQRLKEKRIQWAKRLRRWCWTTSSERTKAIKNSCVNFELTAACLWIQHKLKTVRWVNNRKKTTRMKLTSLLLPRICWRLKWKIKQGSIKEMCWPGKATCSIKTTKLPNWNWWWKRKNKRTEYLNLRSKRWNGWSNISSWNH